VARPPAEQAAADGTNHPRLPGVRLTGPSGHASWSLRTRSTCTSGHRGLPAARQNRRHLVCTQLASSRSARSGRCRTVLLPRHGEHPAGRGHELRCGVQQERWGREGEDRDQRHRSARRCSAEPLPPDARRPAPPSVGSSSAARETTRPAATSKHIPAAAPETTRSRRHDASLTSPSRTALTASHKDPVNAAPTPTVATTNAKPAAGPCTGRHLPAAY
jgi:hypothetical protein